MLNLQFYRIAASAEQAGSRSLTGAGTENGAAL
jgi:hypothetical protein